MQEKPSIMIWIYSWNYPPRTKINCRPRSENRKQFSWNPIVMREFKSMKKRNLEMKIALCGF